MIREAIQCVWEAAQKAKAPVPLPELSGPSEAAYLIDGAVIREPKPAPVRAHDVFGLPDLIALANEFKGDARVWFDAGGVNLVIDDGGHRANRVGLVLSHTEVFGAILALQKKEWIDQKAFVRLLRIDLGRALPPVILLDKVRKLRFDNGQAVTSEVRRDRESLGKSINAAVTSDDGELPEEVTLTFKVYTTPGLSDLFEIDCAVEVDAMRGLFRLVPLPDEVERARQRAVEEVRDKLADGLDEAVPAFHGAP